MYFQHPYGGFFRCFRRILYVAVIMDPFQMSVLVPYILNTLNQVEYKNL